MYVGFQRLLTEFSSLPEGLYLTLLDPGQLPAIEASQEGEWLAILTTDAEGLPMHWILFSAKRVRGYKGEAMSKANTLVKARLWLNLRRPGEIEASAAWLALIDLPAETRRWR